MPSLYDLSTSEASNSTTAGWNTAENQDPSTVNDGMRVAKEILAAFVDDLGGVNTVSGTANALTVALATIAGSNSISAYATGHMLTFKSLSANTTSVTVNVNSIGAKAIRKIEGGTDVATIASDILAGKQYSLVYDTSANSAAGAYIIRNPANIEVGGQIKFPATQNASSDANTLDDYEEGSTAPAVAATGGSLTSASAFLRYTKVGRLVQVKCTVDIVNNGTGSGVLTLSLPFTNSNDYAAAGYGYRTDTLVGLTVTLAANTAAVNIAYYNGTYPGATGQTYVFSIIYNT